MTDAVRHSAYVPPRLWNPRSPRHLLLLLFRHAINSMCHYTPHYRNPRLHIPTTIHPTHTPYSRLFTATKMGNMCSNEKVEENRRPASDNNPPAADQSEATVHAHHNEAGAVQSPPSGGDHPVASTPSAHPISPGHHQSDAAPPSPAAPVSLPSVTATSPGGA